MGKVYLGGTEVTPQNKVYLGESLMFIHAPVFASMDNADVTHIKITFDAPITGAADQETYFTVQDSESTPFAVSATAAGSNSDKLVLTVADFTAAVGDLTVAYDGLGALSSDPASNPVLAFSKSFTPVTA